jgi:Tfp pilus assembly protein PilF
LGAWFFLILAPSSSFLPIVTEVAAEHRVYLPLAAVILLAVLGGHQLLQQMVTCRLQGDIAMLLVVMIALVFGWLTFQRNEVYRNDFSIWADTLAKRPENPRAHINLGGAYMAQGDEERAVAHLMEAIRLEPRMGEAYANLGLVLANKGQMEEALPYFQKAAEFRPQYATVRVNMGIALGKMGRLEEAKEQFEEALRINPNLANAHFNLAVVLARQGKLREAEERFEQALRADPQFDLARQALQDLRKKIAEQSDGNNVRDQSPNR